MATYLYSNCGSVRYVVHIYLVHIPSSPTTRSLMSSRLQCKEIKRGQRWPHPVCVGWKTSSDNTADQNLQLKCTGCTHTWSGICKGKTRLGVQQNRGKQQFLSSTGLILICLQLLCYQGVFTVPHFLYCQERSRKLHSSYGVKKVEKYSIETMKVCKCRR